MAVLLPISIVSYLNFYKMLIPVERFALATNFIMKESATSLTSASADIDPTPAISFLKRHAGLPFSVRINLNAVCFIEKSYHLLSYVFRPNPAQESKSSFIINCDSRYIYVDRNHWIPYHLRYWVPPIFVDIFKTVHVDHPLVYMTGGELVDALQSQMSYLKFNDVCPILIDVTKTTLDFVIEWDGIRFYLVNYYYTSLFFGVLIFWAVSSFTCIVSTAYFYSKFSDNQETFKPEGAVEDKD